MFILLMLLVGLSMSFLIKLNEFSLHSVYRDRLVRAYLGASNAKRKPNEFIGFDPDDNVPLADLRGRSAMQRPFHVVNMALNLVNGKNLAWQQRKAETFTASKLHCGNFRLGYRRTRLYAGRQNGTGLSLGTAFTISGAAANSNMGYHSSPLICFLLTLFNIRLGRWLGNPGKHGQRTFTSPGPRQWAYYTAKEAFGLTDNTSPFVFLSDGGHFENLGIYEMILRRCKIILVCDAGSDPHCKLDNLGNAIRKIRADLGVNINIKHFEIYSRNDRRYAELIKAEVGKYCAIGVIDYESLSPLPNGNRRRNGVFIYLKPAICGTEPKDVFNYKESSNSFPHESTVDQFFNETQFESYRALGLHILDRIYDGQGKFAQDSFENFIQTSRQYADGSGKPVGSADLYEI